MIIKAFIVLLIFVPMKIMGGLYKKCEKREGTDPTLKWDIYDYTLSDIHRQWIHVNVKSGLAYFDSTDSEWPPQGVLFVIKFVMKEDCGDYQAKVRLYINEEQSVKLVLSGPSFSKPWSKKVPIALSGYYHYGENFNAWVEYYANKGEMKVYYGFRKDKILVAIFTDIYLGTINGISATPSGNRVSLNHLCVYESTSFKYAPTRCEESHTGGDIKLGLELAALFVGFFFFGFAVAEYATASAIEAAFMTDGGLTVAAGSAEEAAADEVGAEAAGQSAEGIAVGAAAGERLLISRQVLAGIGKHFQGMIEIICRVGNDYGIGFDVEFNKEYNKTVKFPVCVIISAGKGSPKLKDPPLGGQITYCIGPKGKFEQLPQPGVAKPGPSYFLGLNKKFGKLSSCVQFVVKNVADFIFNHVLPLFGEHNCKVVNEELVKSATTSIKKNWDEYKNRMQQRIIPSKQQICENSQNGHTRYYFC